MTVLRPQYLEQILAGIRKRGVEVRHVLLDADATTLESRIAGGRLGSESVFDWRRQHVQTYLGVRDDLRN